MPSTNDQEFSRQEIRVHIQVVSVASPEAATELNVPINGKQLSSECSVKIPTSVPDGHIGACAS